ncbi:hypothetical protein KY284_035934 [Solanum tuberosum]|nr:hypothetical protein KY284_035934 [Solanum tuberosum]
MGRDINEFELISGTVKPSATAKEAKDVTYILKYDWSHFLCRRLPRDASYKPSHQVLPDLFHIVRISEDGLKEFITWKLGTLILYLVELLCLALNDEFRKYLPDILPCCIQVLTDAERFNDYTYVITILHTLEVFGGYWTHIFACASLEAFLGRNKEELRKAAIDALRCLAHALGEEFSIFIPSIHKLMGPLDKCEPLIFGSTTPQRLNQRLPVEVIGDPLGDGESDLYEVGTDMQKQLELRVKVQGVPRIIF